MTRRPDRFAHRESAAEDRPGIEAIHRQAFGRAAEARLALDILGEGGPLVSVLALHGDDPVAHALLSPLGGAERALALAPVAVVPAHQGEGAGSSTVRFALGLAAARGWRSVFVLGDPGYYERFGFRVALAAGADVPWAGPHFAALELVPGALEGWSGPLVYGPAFTRL